MRTLPQLTFAQILAVHPEDFTVEVEFAHAGRLTSARVRIHVPNATATTGTFALPALESWGLVAFYMDDPRSGVWMGDMHDLRQHAAPLELLADDPRAQATYRPDGSQHLHFSNGDHEWSHPDGGTLLRLTSSDRDPKERTPQVRNVRDGTGSRREEYVAPEKPAPHVHFRRKVGAQGGVEVDITPDGDVSVVLTDAGAERYALVLSASGDVSVRNQAEAELSLTAQGDATVQTVAAILHLTASGSAELTNQAGARLSLSLTGADLYAPPGFPLNLNGTGAPVAHVGSLVGPGPNGLMVLTGNPFVMTSPL